MASEQQPESRRTEADVTPQNEQSLLLEKLSPAARELFAWVRERERRQDWGIGQGRVGAPSPKKRIADHVRQEIVPDQVKK